MKIRACSNCGSIEFVRLSTLKKRKGFFGNEVTDAFVTDRCFFCKELLIDTGFWAEDSLVRDDRTVPTPT